MSIKKTRKICRRVYIISAPSNDLISINQLALIFYEIYYILVIIVVNSIDSYFSRFRNKKIDANIVYS